MVYFVVAISEWEWVVVWGWGDDDDDDDDEGDDNGEGPEVEDLDNDSDDGGVQRKEGHSRLRTRTGSKIFRNETTREEVNKILH